MKYYNNVVVGTPILESWRLFCTKESEWEEFKEKVLFTNERYLPQILVECGIAKSTDEIRKNKPELDRLLDSPDFVIAKYGKRYVAIQVGD